ncbi:hypothetical protein [Azonexus hydrophilus]|jgi:acid phosphatase family membrane protein YuiD|uniref:Uncharacterized protein n=1 Tax=Azonexus hydrophilus TaxID=418702 RepID=A0ABZ2XEH6_9RHOO|nr:hypothetical protein [Azonexus hydrophilus]MBS4020278.1 hypothetical protein [Dechloromonas sp.]MCA1937755.1 hypothetical protein [Dechloromonas sp.]
MPKSDIWAATLSLVLIHEETGCRQSALHAARLLEHLCDQDIDHETRELCERASQRLGQRQELHHACPA